MIQYRRLPTSFQFHFLCHLQQHYNLSKPAVCVRKLTDVYFWLTKLHVLQMSNCIISQASEACFLGQKTTSHLLPYLVEFGNPNICEKPYDTSKGANRLGWMVVNTKPTQAINNLTRPWVGLNWAGLVKKACLHEQ